MSSSYVVAVGVVFVHHGVGRVVASSFVIKLILLLSVSWFLVCSHSIAETGRLIFSTLCKYSDLQLRNLFCHKQSL